MEFRPMRRHAQQITAAECEEILKTEKRGVLAVLGDEDYPYALPLDYVYEDGVLYFHCAKEGHKLDALRRSDKASFCVMTAGEQEPGAWWYHVQSVIAFGRIRLLEDRAQVEEKLRLLGRKYFPAGYDMEADMQKNAARAEILALTVEHMTGKRVREK